MSMVQADARSGGECSADSRLRKWREAVEPWIKAVVLSALFLMAILQSLTFIAKYLESPKTSVISLRPVEPQDAPWITICPIPAFRVPKLADFIHAARLDPGAFDVVGFTGQQLAAVPRTNRTLDDFFYQVASPLWTHNFMCSDIDPFLQPRDSPADDEEVPTFDLSTPLCIFADGLFDVYTALTDEPDIDLEVMTESRMEAETGLGVWETQLIALEENSMVFCSTFKPNFPPNTRNIGINMNPVKMNGPPETSNKRLQEAVYRGKLRPSYAVFITEPYKKPFPYHFVHGRGQIMEKYLSCGDKLEVRMQIKRFQFLRTPDNPCSEDNNTNNFYDECVTQCFETEFLSETCRIPGFRDSSAFSAPELPVVPVCSTTLDYQRLQRKVALSNHSMAIKRILERCETHVCKKPCTILEYDLQVKAPTRKDVKTTPEIIDFWKTCGSPWSTTIKIMSTSPRVTAVQEQYAYDIHQLVSELGGSWGLFLGFSIVNLIQWIYEALVEHVVARFE